MKKKKWSLKKKMKELDKQIAWAKKHPVLEFLRRLPYILKELPSDIQLWCREKYGRAKNGWSVPDAWGFDWYLAKVITEGCEWLREHKHGYPICINEDINNSNYTWSQESEDCNIKKWNEILDNIIWTFHIARKIQANNWMYPLHRDYFTDEELKKNIEFCNKMQKKFNEECHVMTKEECEKYRLGWRYFELYFFSLWD